MLSQELKCTVILKSPVSFHAIGERIGALLHYAMQHDKDLEKLHLQTGPKHYVYSHLYPTEKDGVYKPGIGYFFRIRSADQSFLLKMEQLLARFHTAQFVVLSVEKTIIPAGTKRALKTLTPFVITLKNSDSTYWKVNDSPEDIRHLLNQTMLSKYTKWVGVPKIEHMCVERVDMLNRVPTYYEYKERRILGNKAVVYFREDELSEKIRRFVACAGLGEKSSVLGSGFAETL